MRKFCVSIAMLLFPFSTTLAGLPQPVGWGSMQVTGAWSYAPVNLQFQPERHLALYGLSIAGSYGYLGGWENLADQQRARDPNCSVSIAGCVVGQDRLFQFNRKLWQNYQQVQVKPLTWNNTDPRWQPVWDPYPINGIPTTGIGYHLNDPTVVFPPSTNGVNRETWQYLYATCLPSDMYAEPNNALYNRVCLSASSDGGNTWTFVGEVVMQNNGLNERGGWAPSAIVRDSQIWLYYHLNTGDFGQIGGLVFRQKLDANGITRIGPPEQVRLQFDMNSKFFGSSSFQTAYDSKDRPLSLINVDVKYDEASGLYVMLGDDFDNNGIKLLYSTDGLNFQPYAYSITQVCNGVTVYPQFCLGQTVNAFIAQTLLVQRTGSLAENPHLISISSGGRDLEFGFTDLGVKNSALCPEYVTDPAWQALGGCSYSQRWKVRIPF